MKRQEPISKEWALFGRRCHESLRQDHWVFCHDIFIMIFIGVHIKK
jgi:hypothetical protein